MRRLNAVLTKAGLTFVFSLFLQGCVLRAGSPTVDFQVIATSAVQSWTGTASSLSFQGTIVCDSGETMDLASSPILLNGPYLEGCHAELVSFEAGSLYQYVQGFDPYWTQGGVGLYEDADGNRLYVALQSQLTDPMLSYESVQFVVGTLPDGGIASVESRVRAGHLERNSATPLSWELEGSAYLGSDSFFGFTLGCDQALTGQALDDAACGLYPLATTRVALVTYSGAPITTSYLQQVITASGESLVAGAGNGSIYFIPEGDASVPTGGFELESSVDLPAGSGSRSYLLVAQNGDAFAYWVVTVDTTAPLLR